MDKMILKDGSEIYLESGSSISDLRVTSESREDMMDTWKKMTKENLKLVIIKNESGLVVAEYNNLVLGSETSVVDETSGKVTTSYRMEQSKN